jgi:hypothetical protein
MSSSGSVLGIAFKKLSPPRKVRRASTHASAVKAARNAELSIAISGSDPRPQIWSSPEPAAAMSA